MIYFFINLIEFFLCCPLFKKFKNPYKKGFFIGDKQNNEYPTKEIMNIYNVKIIYKFKVARLNNLKKLLYNSFLFLKFGVFCGCNRIDSTA